MKKCIEGEVYYFDEKCTAVSVTGTRKTGIGSGCDDVYRICKVTGLRLLGLADGQTGKPFCRTGGTEVIRAVFRYILRAGIDQMAGHEHVDELQYELIRVIRGRIAELQNAYGGAITDYASTLVVFAHDTKTGSYVLIHLGDGGVIGERKSGKISMISPPENGLTAKYTWLTTSEEALKHLRISFGSTGPYKRILMITDGADAVARGKNISESAKRLIKRGSHEDIVSFITRSEPADDASCIIADINPGLETL